MALTPGGTPFVEASDLVADYPATSLALAEHIDDLADPGGLVHINTTTFSAVSSVSINDVFTSTFENYKVIVSPLTSSIANTVIAIRYRASGTDNSSSNYFSQSLEASGTSVSAVRQSFQTSSRIGNAQISGPNCINMDIFSPQLVANQSAFTQNILASGSPTSINMSHMLLVASAFDGFTLFPASGTFSGTIRVYGYKNS